MKKRFDKIYTKNDLYYDYTKTLDVKVRVPKKEWTRYIKIIISVITDWILEGNFYIFPYKIGYVYIIKNKPEYFYLDKEGVRRPRRAFINWDATRKLREKKEPGKSKEYWHLKENRSRYVVVFTNEHTNGYFYRIYYKFMNLEDSKGRLRMSYYRLVTQLAFKQKLSNYIKTNKKLPQYYEKDKYFFDNGAFKKKVTEFYKNRT